MFYNNKGLPLILLSCLFFGVRPVLWAAQSYSTAVIDIRGDITTDALFNVRRQITLARENDANTIIFRFDGIGESFDTFADLGRDIALLKQKDNVTTIAWVPKQARGMMPLAVLACRKIAVDNFAQIGQIVMDNPAASGLDEQAVLNKAVTLAQAGGHETVWARAMVRKNDIIYLIKRGGKTKAVDQKGFEQAMQEPNTPWTMVGSGPLVSSSETLLLSGQQAVELGLAEIAASDSDELLEKLKLSPIEIKPEATTEKSDTPKRLVTDKPPRAVVIVCADMIDQGLYQSIKRRTEDALNQGATTIIYEIDTYGGRVDSALEISGYLMHEVSPRALTVAYVPTKAISAGALISVACNDIIMKKSTVLGDCAPIAMGGKLEGVEREKIESPLRTNFRASAKANNYPEALCEAMVTVGLEVWQLKNLSDGQYEYFRSDEMPTDPFKYDLPGKKLIVKADELLTMDAEEAYQYGFARAVVDDREGALKFLEERDEVTYPRPVVEVHTNWSEEMVRWINSPTVAGLLLMVALIGIYAELNSPGVGLPGAVAVVALVILFGSKFVIGMANWWEIAVFVMGIFLIAAEIFVIPGFGVPGIAGILMVMFALGAMMVGNPPDEFPMPHTEQQWQLFESHLLWTMLAVIAFVFFACLLARFFPNLPLANRLILKPSVQAASSAVQFIAEPVEQAQIKIGDRGRSTSVLRPAGNAFIHNQPVQVVARGEFIDADSEIEVVAMEGNSIVVMRVEC